MGLITSNIRSRWPGNCVMYAFDPDLTEAETDVLKDAMRWWTDTGDVRFAERKHQDRYLKFIPDEVPWDRVCSSDSIGMSSGVQHVRVDPTIGTGQAAHEIGHVLGFFHEQCRSDREPFIDVHEEAMQDSSSVRYQFRIISPADSDTPTDYDFRSIMHYSSDAFSRDGTTPVITTDDPANQRLIGQRSRLSDGDKVTAEFLDKGNQHVYQLTHHGQIETVVQHRSSNRRWSIARPFAAGLSNYVFLLRTSTGRVQVSQMKGDGSVGPVKHTANWSSGWTEAVVYDAWGTDYLLLYKRSNGEIHQHRIGGDGSIGEKIVDGAIEPGWTNAAHYSIGVNNFMLFSNSQSGHLRIYEIRFDGVLGQSKYEGTFSPGWSIVKPYSVFGGTFLYRLNTESGAVSIRKLDGNGDVKETIQTLDWTSGWTSSIPYEVGISDYLLSVKAGTGDLSIRSLEGNGRIGPETDRRTIKPGFNLAAVYGVGLSTFLVLIDG
jgi:hypothetical protein